MQNRSSFLASRTQRAQPRFGYRQRGVILVVSLVVLVAMMLGAVALIRSVETSNVIAGNLAFQQGTLNAGDSGVASAVAQLQGAGAAALLADAANKTYYATMRASDANGQLSDVAFNAANPGATPAALDWSAVPVAQTVDSDYEVKIVVDRLCRADGVCVTDPPDPCYTQTVGFSCGGTPATHYRATVRVAGPRNTVSVTQATLAW